MVFTVSSSMTILEHYHHDFNCCCCLAVHSANKCPYKFTNNYSISALLLAW